MAKLRLVSGVILVLILGGALFLYLDYSMSRVHSVDGQLESDNYTIGADYSGIIVDQYVREGSYVEVGDPLFRLRSTSLAEAIRDDEVAQAALLYSADEDGTILISAAAPGKVQSIAYRKGAFVPANSPIAVVNNENGLYVSATYALLAPDYSRLKTDSLIYVDLPSGEQVRASVYDVTLERVDDEVRTTVRARLQSDEAIAEAFSVGTPIESVLELSTDTLFERIVGGVTSVFTPASRN